MYARLTAASRRARSVAVDMVNVTLAVRAILVYYTESWGSLPVAPMQLQSQTRTLRQRTYDIDEIVTLLVASKVY